MPESHEGHSDEVALGTEQKEAKKQSEDITELQKEQTKKQGRILTILGCMPGDAYTREDKLKLLEEAEKVIQELIEVDKKLKARNELEEAFEWYRDNGWKIEIEVWKKLFGTTEVTSIDEARAELSEIFNQATQDIAAHLKGLLASIPSRWKSSHVRDTQMQIENADEIMVNYCIKNDDWQNDPLVALYNKELKIFRAELIDALFKFLESEGSMSTEKLFAYTQAKEAVRSIGKDFDKQKSKKKLTEEYIEEWERKRNSWITKLMETEFRYNINPDVN